MVFERNVKFLLTFVVKHSSIGLCHGTAAMLKFDQTHE